MAEASRALRARAAVELVALLALFILMAWKLAPMAASQAGALVYLGFVLGLATHVMVLSPRLYPVPLGVVSGLASPREGFLRRDTWLAGAPAYLLSIVAGCGILFAAGRMTGMAGMSTDIGDIALKFARYLFFAAMQAYVYFEFLRPRLMLALGDRAGTLTVALFLAGIFMVAHAPNPYLMLATPIAGFVWALLYASYPNYFWVVLSHAILGTSVQIMTLWPTRTGAAFWNPDHYAFRSALKHLFTLVTPP